MIEYYVNIEINGNPQPVGIISGQTPRDVCFRYLTDYCSDPQAMPISVCLPLQEDAFDPGRTRNFFEGLLPEGFTRHFVAGWMHLDAGDYLSILHGLGRECIGAISITAGEEMPFAAYEKISPEEVKRLAAEGASTSAELVTKAHISLTGATGKVGLYYDDTHDDWYLPAGTAPSTHIVKQSHVRLESIVTNEQLCMMTARRCGISVPESFIINTGNAADGEVLYATRRYDRMFRQNAVQISGLPRPSRLHQEDFAQALGISSTEKYEAEERHYLKQIFTLLRQYSADPVVDQLMLWDSIVFDFLIGNTDAHLKNFSLLYSPDLKSIRLAPAYDIVSTIVYESSTRDMAFRIGEDINLDRICRESFMRAAKEAGLGAPMAMKRLESMQSIFRSALLSSADELMKKGFLRADEIAGRILRDGGIAKLSGSAAI